jgi:hypothetical protein
VPGWLLSTAAIKKGWLMVKILKLKTVTGLFLLSFPGSQAAETTEAPDEIVVVGRQPGPPGFMAC